MVEDKKYEINVIVRTAYLPEQSDEAIDHYVFREFEERLKDEAA